MRRLAIGTTGGRGSRSGAALLAGLIVVLSQSPLSAQQTVGRSSAPSVSIDYGVLDSLGPPPNVPSTLLEGSFPRAPAHVQGAPARTFSPPAALRGGSVVVRGGSPRFPVVSGPNASLPMDDHVVLVPPARQRTVRKSPAPAPRAARSRPPQAVGKPPVPMARKAPAPAKPAPPARLARKRAPPPPALPAAPPVPPEAAPPMAPAPAPPAVADLPPPNVASLPPPPALPAPPDVAPPPAPVSEPAATSAPKPVSKPAPKPAAKPSRPPAPPAETAALSRPTAPTLQDGKVQVLFPAGSAKLDKAATDGMAPIVDAMKADSSMRIQLLAYASAAGGSASQARRLSLSRALAARSYLIGQGVRSTRIDVRALGNKSSAGPPDRVDLIAVRR